MNVAFADASAATIRLLERTGCTVVTPTNLGCCGAPQEDQGARHTARDFARRLIAEFEQCGPLDVIVTDSAGCGSILKEYSHLLHDDPAWAERAERFSALMRDSNEFLAERVKACPPKRAIRRRVTYHDPCHLLNTQKVRSQPREMLRAIPELELIELPDSNWCCGSAGIYNITHPAMAQKVLARKIDSIAATGAEVLVTANPGCLMQIQMGLRQRGLRTQVMHISEMLDQAYEGAR
jgi:glycolate oxidase iron-sulfur subunit